MEILLTGNLSPISKEFCERIAEDNKLVVCGSGATEANFSAGITPYDYGPQDEEFEAVFRSYNFKVVLFFAKEIDGAKKVFDELEEYEKTLYVCGKCKVPRVIYIRSNDMYEVTEDFLRKSSRHIVMEACENLSLNFSGENGIDITLLRIPYLYNLKNKQSALSIMVKSAFEERKIVFPGFKNTLTDFLWDMDLAELVLRIIDQPERGFFEMNLSGKAAMTFGELAKVIQKFAGHCSVDYKDDIVGVPQFLEDTQPREKYGWFPKADMQAKIEEYKKEYEGSKVLTRMDAIRQKFTSFFTKKVMVILELVAFAIIAQWVQSVTSKYSQLQIVDMRFLYVTIMGTMYGLRTGAMAAVFACVGYFWDEGTTTSWQTVFYNIENWLPFAAYLVIGTVTGYTSDVAKDRLRAAKEQKKIIENKYVFLSELYVKTLKNKDEFNSQIIGYRDSYGKIYSVVQRLNTVVQDEVFTEAIGIMEEMFENKSIAIYSMERNSNFARLRVCSATLVDTLSKSLDLEERREMYHNLTSEQAWKNVEGLEGYPSYVYPIFNQDDLLGLICIQEAEPRQLNMEFYNKFCIVGGLVTNALIRAMDRKALTESQTFVPGTRILKTEEFQKELEAKQKMREKDIADYVMLKIESDEMSESELSECVSKCIRNMDTLGKDAEGNICLILSQTTQNAKQLIASRLKNDKIILTEVGF